MKFLKIAVIAMIPVAGSAQNVSIDSQVIAACFANTPVGNTNPDCIGAAANACQTATPDGSTTMGITECISAENAVWDSYLNDEYGKTRAQLAENDKSGGEGYVSVADSLRDAQRAWIAFRDAECAFSWSQFQGGTMRSIVGASCVMSMTATRALQLRDIGQEGY